MKEKRKKKVKDPPLLEDKRAKAAGVPGSLHSLQVSFLTQKSRSEFCLPTGLVQCERSHQPRPPWCVTKCDPGSGVLGSDESDPSKQPHLQAPCQQLRHTQLHTLYLSLSFLPLALSPVPCPSTARIGMPSRMPNLHHRNGPDTRSKRIWRSRTCLTGNVDYNECAHPTS